MYVTYDHLLSLLLDCVRIVWQNVRRNRSPILPSLYWSSCLLTNLIPVRSYDDPNGGSFFFLCHFRRAWSFATNWKSFSRDDLPQLRFISHYYSTRVISLKTRGVISATNSVAVEFPVKFLYSLSLLILFVREILYEFFMRARFHRRFVDPCYVCTLPRKHRSWLTQNVDRHFFASSGRAFSYLRNRPQSFPPRPSSLSRIHVATTITSDLSLRWRTHKLRESFSPVKNLHSAFVHRLSRRRL